jgi:hypothetical protein
VPECARAVLHAALHPSDDRAGSEQFRGPRGDVRRPLGHEAARRRGGERLLLVERGPVERVPHRGSARNAQAPVRHVHRGAEARAVVARCGLHEHFVEDPLAQEPAVRDAVQRDASGHHEAGEFRLAPQSAREREHDLLSLPLQRVRDGAVVVLQLLLVRARRAELLDEALREEPRAAALVAEPGEVLVERTVVARPEDAREARDEPVVAVGSEAHHLPLVARRPPSEPVGDGLPHLADGVRVARRREAHERALVHAREHRRLRLARAVDRQRRGLREPARPERAVDVRSVVVDEVQTPAESGLRADPAADAEEAAPERRPLREVVAARGEVPQEVDRVDGQPLPRVHVEGRVLDVADRRARRGDARLDRAFRHPEVVLHAREPLLLERHDDLAVAKERGRGVVRRVDPEDEHRGTLPAAARAFTNP